MKNFNRGDRSGGRRFGNRDSERPTMYKAICSECDKDCEVPFKPTGDRPIFCNECFAKKRGGNADRSRGRDTGDKKMYTAICHNCSNKCEVPFQPTPGKPVYCNNCFGKVGRTEGGKGGGNGLEKKLDMLNSKLDKILEVLTPTQTPAVKETKKPATAKKAKATTKKPAKKTTAKKK